MLNIKKIFNNVKSHMWTTLKDTVYPKRFRRHYSRFMRDTKPYYPWNPGFANEYTPRSNEIIENDFRTSFKDSTTFNIRYSD
jgi:hypothetical protein